MSAPTTQAGTVPEDEKSVGTVIAMSGREYHATIRYEPILNGHPPAGLDVGTKLYLHPDRSTRDTETAALQAEMEQALGRAELAEYSFLQGTKMFFEQQAKLSTAEQQLSELRAEMETVRAERDQLVEALRLSETERVAALSALRLAADRLYEQGAPEAFVDDARAVLLGFSPEGERIADPRDEAPGRTECSPEQVASLFEELAQGPVQGGKNAQIAYAKCAKIVRSKLARSASREGVR